MSPDQGIALRQEFTKRPLPSNFMMSSGVRVVQRLVKGK
jgi:hypothetical protein